MLWTLIKKEFLDIVRDRRTLVMSLAIPLLIFPVMMVVANKVQTSNRKSALEKVMDVALISNGAGEAFRKALLREGTLLTKKGSIRLREDVALEEGRQLIESGDLDVLVLFDRDFERAMAASLPGRISVYYKRTADAGWAERDRIRKLLKAYDDELYDVRMAELGLDAATILRPVEINEFNLATEKEALAGAAGRILPYMFIMFAIMGVIHLATDLAAGERERGTLETLFTIPAGRLQIFFAKFLVVVTSGFVSGAVTLGSMYLGLRLMDKGLGELNKAISSLLEPVMILAVLGLIRPLTVFFAAIAMTISVYAKSFKEAQSLMAPLIMVSIMPLAVSMVPGMELSAKTAMVPILNVSLAIKAIIGDSAEFLHLVMVYGSLIAISLVGIYLCSFMFKREAAVFRT